MRNPLSCGLESFSVLVGGAVVLEQNMPIGRLRVVEPGHRPRYQCAVVQMSDHDLVGAGRDLAFGKATVELDPARRVGHGAVAAVNQ